MTTQPYGYPDWSRIVNAAGALKDSTDQAIATERVGPVFPTYDHAYLSVSVQALSNTNHYFVQIFWCNDAVGSESVATSSFTTVPGGEMSLPVPVLGPFAFTIVTNIEGGADSHFVYWAYSSDAAIADTLVTMPGQPLVHFSGNINSGATQELDAASLYRGPAQLFVTQGTNNSWHAQLDYWDHASVSWNTLMVFHGAAWGQDLSLPIRLPPAPVRLIIGNDDAVTRLMRASIIT